LDFVEELWPFVALIAVVFAVYSNVYANAFLYDDINSIVNNQLLRSWHNIPTLFRTHLSSGSNSASTYYRPLTVSLYLLVFQIAGLQAYAFHLLNVLFHAGNACLIFCLGRKLKFHPFAAFLGALLWAVHPVHVEAVTYMSGTTEVLYAFFCLCAAIVLLPDFSRRRIGAASLLFILALLSKESAIAFPLLAGVLVYYKDEKRFDPRTYLRLWPLAGIAIIYIALRLGLAPDAPNHKLAPTDPWSAATSGLEPFAAFPMYVRLLLAPTHLYMNHAVRASGALWTAQLLAGFSLAGFAAWQVMKPQTLATLPLSWGILWFIGAFSPVSCVGTIVYEHWLYLPLAGILLGAGETTAGYVKNRRKIFTKSVFRHCLVAAAVPICVLGVLTWRQNEIWREPVVFYNNIIDANDPAPEAHINLGLYYYSHADYDAALKQFDLAEKDFALSTDTFTVNNRAFLQAYIALTLLSSMQEGADRQGEALRRLEKAIEIDPECYPALVKLAEIYRQQGDTLRAKACEDKTAALRRKFGTSSE
jgi:hypothetical protein